VGRLADLAAYRLDSIPFTPLNDPLRQLVFAETGADLDFVMIDGEVVMNEGRLTRVEEPALLAEIVEEHAKLAPLIKEAEALVERMRPHYERIYERCHAAAIDSATYPARFPG
jgi:5-methylthioadenosine/S-adenosylhomocysteine deaminase